MAVYVTKNNICWWCRITTIHCCGAVDNGYGRVIRYSGCTNTSALCTHNFNITFILISVVLVFVAETTCVAFGEWTGPFFWFVSVSDRTRCASIPSLRKSVRVMFNSVFVRCTAMGLYVGRFASLLRWRWPCLVRYYYLLQLYCNNIVGRRTHSTGFWSRARWHCAHGMQRCCVTNNSDRSSLRVIIP